MFLKLLRIENIHGMIRDIKFHAGLNLIVDETNANLAEATGNNVGKTTVLMLIDFCLGASAKGIYTDPENKKTEYKLVKNFLIDTHTIITLVMSDDLANPLANELVIERNFLSRNKMIRKINGKQMTEEEFEETLTNQLFSDHYGKKPTFPQIISHNIRYKELGVTNTLRTLNQYTREDEYETLHLFLLGCGFEQGDAKQNILAEIRVETSFKSRLESAQTRSAYETSLALLLVDIEKLNEKKSSLQVNPNFELDLQKLDEIKYKVSLISSSISRSKLRQNLVVEAMNDIKLNHFQIDISQLKSLYNDATGKLDRVQKTFEELVEFHNKMVEEKARYISKELPLLGEKIQNEERELRKYLEEEKVLAERIAKSDSFEELESLVISLNEKYRRKGEFEIIIQQIASTELNLKNLNLELTQIDETIFSTDFESLIQTQLNKLNKHFSEISDELYGEQYALKYDIITSRTGQRIYKFSSFNTNFSSGKKQGEITCFDIAYTLFADEENIPCYHFLLNDKKELMHDNQLSKIAKFVGREKNHVQFVASILRDKLPSDLNKEEYFIVKLSQEDKLFRIESHS
ncbi:DUF2326 domain-containing protein [Undibacterium amnicola]|uniref:DUF2326 domain-containing protein n=1 Tax=Undibacterium amnicola TaxID=1834038 RepID=A0ABR6XMY1_9BURK|nr:DUF2326 domain-containing protein [Undibacterium amnicola]MBC3830875.1 DUF2326 domain-containing protein [Undibacterium amnicola]